MLFGIAEIASLYLIFYGPQSTLVLTIAFIIYGFTLSGLLAVLGGLFAIDIAPKNITGAAMGFIGLFSYIGAAIQEKISSVLIQTTQSDLSPDIIYNFDDVIVFWISASIISFFFFLIILKSGLRYFFKSGLTVMYTISSLFKSSHHTGYRLFKKNPDHSL